MTLESFFLSVLLLILLARVLGILFAKFNFQSLVGEVLGGVILSPLLLGWIVPNETLKIFSEFGIIMLMLLSGLLTDYRKFQEHKFKSILVGVLGVLFSMILIFSVMYALGFGLIVSLLISVILSNTAVEVCARLLMNKTAGKNTHAIIMGASFVDDIVAVFLIGVVGSIALGTEVTPQYLTFISARVILFIVLSLIIIPYFMERYRVIDHLIGSGPQREKVLLTFTILFAILFAIIAHYSGLQGIIGAYIAGLIIGQWGSKVGPLLRRRVAYDDLVDDIEPMSHALFTPLFFGYVGLQLGSILSSFVVTTLVVVLVISISIMALLGKLIGCGLGARLSGLSRTESGFIGLAMGGRGALELVLLTISYDKGIISGELFAAVVIVTLITVIATPLLLTFYERKFMASP
ncbi:MAG: cation:proton antiporter [Euryarchaeota archaeon]|nr:cation:proton antiporter [Euryarchaeota archaeon]